MEKTQVQVPFDLGISKYYPTTINAVTVNQLGGIGKLKSQNQRKYQITMFENSVAKGITTIAAIYYGCVVYASIIKNQHKDNPAEVVNNPMLLLSESERNTIDLTSETVIIKDLYTKTNESVSYYLKRASKLPANFNYCADLYAEFVTKNNNFIELTRTNQIQLPENMEHFSAYNKSQLEDAYDRFKKAIETGELVKIFDIT